MNAWLRPCGRLGTELQKLLTAEGAEATQRSQTKPTRPIGRREVRARNCGSQTLCRTAHSLRSQLIPKQAELLCPCLRTRAVQYATRSAEDSSCRLACLHREGVTVDSFAHANAADSRRVAARRRTPPAKAERCRAQQ